MKKFIENIKGNLILILVVLLSGLFLGWLAFHQREEAGSAEMRLEDHDHSEGETAVWTCSMHPQIKQDKPGKCPICAMDLIPLTTVESSGSGLDPDAIVMTESAAKLADVQTMAVMRGTPRKTIYLQGKVQADERNITELTARFGGRIEKLFVNFTGQNVKKGEKLATLYSPDLVTAQQELLEAISFKESRPSYYRSARAKLQLWDLTDEQINDIEENGEPRFYFDVVAPISGTVMMRHVTLGDYVKEGSPLFQVTDLSRVWVMLDAYESDLPWIRTGDQVELTVPSLPGRALDGRVTYIDPFLDPATRVVKVRMELPNPGLNLKPETFANAVVHSNIAESSDQLLIPKSSILWTGKRAVVYVRLPEAESPTFRYREITLGPEAGDSYVVADGLDEGEVIAINGVFKIDAAAQLEGKPSMMNPGGGMVSTGHDHGSMEPSSPSTPATPVAQTVHEHMEMAETMDQVDNEFLVQLQGVYDAYLPMKNAFVASDAGAVRTVADKVGKLLKDVDMTLLEGNPQRIWMDQLNKMETEIALIAGTTDISDQRKAFALFNDAFYESLKSFGLHHGTVYYQYCPMANGDQGAFWISEIEDIENPYFGDEMLTCGETRETLEF